MSTEETKKPLYPEVNYGSTQPPPYNQPVVNQPQLQHNPLMVTSFEGHREWTTGLFDCLDDPATCLLTCMCHPCSLCYLGSRMGEHFCMPMCVPASNITIRNKIRTVGGIRGTMCTDCVTASFCGPCSTCQDHRELTNMGIK